MKRPLLAIALFLLGIGLGFVIDTVALRFIDPFAAIRYASDSYSYWFPPPTVDLFRLTRCRTDDVSDAEKTIARFVVGQAANLRSSPVIFSLAQPKQAYTFYRREDGVVIYVTTDAAGRITVRYAYPPDANPGAKAVTDQDRADLAESGFKPDAAC